MASHGKGPVSKRKSVSDLSNSENKRSKSELDTRGFIPLQARSSQNITNTSASSSKNVNKTVIAPIQTSNSFNIGDKTLEDIAMQDESVDRNNSENKTPTVRSKQKVPPITVIGSNISVIQNMLNTSVVSKKFSIKINSVGIRINTVDEKDYKIVQEQLKTMKNDGKITGYFNYHTADSKPYKIILRHFYKVETNDLKKKLNELNIFPTNISTLRRRVENNSSIVYLLYFASGSVKLSDLKQIKEIENVEVKWEKYIPKNHDSAPQCRNCQMYGHSSINCNMPTKCLVCGLDHTTISCTNRVSKATLEHVKSQGDDVDRSFIKCANCGNQHTANYKGCIARQAFINIRKNTDSRHKKGLKTGFRLDPNEYPSLPTHQNFQDTVQQFSQHQRWSDTVNESVQQQQQYNNHQQQQQWQQQQQHFDMQMQLLSRQMVIIETLMSKLTIMIDSFTQTLSGSEKILVVKSNDDV